MANSASIPSSDSRIEIIVREFIMKLKRRKISGAYNCGIATAELLRSVIDLSRFENAQQILDRVTQIGRRLENVRPIELTIGNVVRRVLEFIREVAKPVETDDDDETIISSGLRALMDEKTDGNFTDFVKGDIKHDIIQEMIELIDEITNVFATISDLAVEHIHAREVIMTFGRSKAVFEFLKEAARFRKFEVIIAESAPNFDGQLMAVELAKEGIDSTVITDSAIFAMMSRVNKVIIGSHAVFGTGGILAFIGTHGLAVAAKYHAVPVVVLCGLYKLCPKFINDPDELNEFKSPSKIMRYEKEIISLVNVENPAYDYVPPEYVSLFITNLGGYSPSYIYRLLAEIYNPQDYEL